MGLILRLFKAMFDSFLEAIYQDSFKGVQGGGGDPLKIITERGSLRGYCQGFLRFLGRSSCNISGGSPHSKRVVIFLEAIYKKTFLGANFTTFDTTILRPYFLYFPYTGLNFRIKAYIFAAAAAAAKAYS